MSNRTHNLILIGASSSLLIKNSYSSCSHYPLTVRLFQQIIEVQHQHLSVGLLTSLVVIILILHFIENISHSNFLNLGSLQFSSIWGEKKLQESQRLLWSEPTKYFTFLQTGVPSLPCQEWILISWTIFFQEITIPMFTRHWRSSPVRPRPASPSCRCRGSAAARATRRCWPTLEQTLTLTVLWSTLVRTQSFPGSGGETFTSSPSPPSHTQRIGGTSFPQWRIFLL